MAVHSLHFCAAPISGKRPRLACGRTATVRDPHTTPVWARVTCKRCLAVYADRQQHIHHDTVYTCNCGSTIPTVAGKYGCPNCCGDEATK